MRSYAAVVAMALIGLLAEGPTFADDTINPAPAPVERLPGVKGAKDEPAEVVPTKSADAVEHVSGGVGGAEQTALKNTDDYNLRVTMATPSGHYGGGAAVHIENPQGQTMLDTVSDGPVLLAKLPAGTYHVRVIADGQTTTHTVSVPNTGQEELSITWPELHPQD